MSTVSSPHFTAPFTTAVLDALHDVIHQVPVAEVTCYVAGASLLLAHGLQEATICPCVPAPEPPGLLCGHRAAQQLYAAALARMGVPSHWVVRYTEDVRARLAAAGHLVAQCAAPPYEAVLGNGCVEWVCE